MNTIENNKLIAEFMGLTIITDNISFFDTGYNPLKNYHSDWNYLMEIVNNIENLGKYEIDIQKKIDCDNTCQINWLKTPYKYMVISVGLGKTKIQAVYNACVQFITWYNENNK